MALRSDSSNRCHFDSKWPPSTLFHVALSPSPTVNFTVGTSSINLCAFLINTAFGMVSWKWHDSPPLSTVTPPSDLRFKILNENTVQMLWKQPLSRIEGLRVIVTSDTGGWKRESTAHVEIVTPAWNVCNRFYFCNVFQIENMRTIFSQLAIVIRIVQTCNGGLMNFCHCTLEQTLGCSRGTVPVVSALYVD